MSRKTTGKVGPVAVLVVGGLLLLTLAGWGVWTFFEAYISPKWTRVWAIAATSLLPVVGWACYGLGQTESKGKLAGIDAGVDRVMRAATRATHVRVQATQAMRQATPHEPPVAILPPLEYAEQRQLDSRDVIDL